MVQAGMKDTPINVEMSSYEDVMDNITSAASGLEEGQKVAMSGKSAAAKALRKSWLLNQGLSQADWNTLTSEYIKRYGVPESKESIAHWVNEMVDNYLTSGMDIDATGGSKGKGTGPGTGTGAFAAPVGPTQQILIGTKQAMTTMKSPDLTPTQRREIEEQQKQLQEEIGEPLLNQIKRNSGKDEGAQIDIIQPISKSLWTANKTPISKDAPMYSLNEAPLTENRIFQSIAENPNVVTTADGRIVPQPENMIPDSSRDSFVVMEDGKPVMYMPVLYYEDTFGWGDPDIVEESDFIGRRDEASGSYDDGTIGDVEDATGKAKKYTRIMNAQRKVLGEDAVDNEWQWLSTDDDIYEGVIRVPLVEDYEQQARIADGNPVYTDKATQTAYTAPDQSQVQVKNWAKL
jgi:hypothetical protein